jgi:putative transposase
LNYYCTYVIIKQGEKNMAEVHHGRGYVYSIQYHIVWCTKYRRKVLEGKTEEKIKELINWLADINKYAIISMEVMPDHIHLLLDCSPQHYIPNIIKSLKGVSARLLFEAYPEIKSKLWKGHLWNPSYYVATVSENTEEQIKEYISSQKER